MNVRFGKEISYTPLYYSYFNVRNSWTWLVIPSWVNYVANSSLSIIKTDLNYLFIKKINLFRWNSDSLAISRL